jgi:hypothetical protein
LLPCQSLRRDEHMGTGMGMMLTSWPPFTKHRQQQQTSVLYTSALIPRIFTRTAYSIPSELPYPVQRLHKRTQIAGWAKTAKPLVPSFRSLGAKLRPNRCPPYPLLKTEDNASCEPPLRRGAIAQHTHIALDPARIPTTTPFPTAQSQHHHHSHELEGIPKGRHKGAIP